MESGSYVKEPVLKPRIKKKIKGADYLIESLSDGILRI